VAIALYLLGALLLLAGLAGLILPVLPGAVFLFAGALAVAWAGDFQRLGWPTLTVVGVLAALSLVVDWAATALGARASGAWGWAVAGASIGLVIGLFLGPLGILLGPAVGAVALEYWKDPDFDKALRAGAGTFVGFLIGSVLKVGLAFLLLGVIAVGLVV
jgi:uncharacterized protein YqgC (DUF456 family)